MWHTSEKVKTFAGAFSFLLAYGLDEMLELLENCYEFEDDDHRFGHRAFANLTLEQKVWTVHKVAFGLLDRKTPIVPLTAYTEATVATIFRRIEDLVTFEIDMETDDDDESGLRYTVRRAILAVHEETGLDSPDIIDDDEPLKADCADMDEWKFAIESIECTILWDMDYDIRTFEDGPPDLNAKKRQKFGIDDDYFSAIPDDPKPAEAKKLLRETRKLCDRVIKREEKKILKTAD